jgi:hypothetical protein
VTYGTDRLLQEVTYVAYHLHWPMHEILDLDHDLRKRFVEDVAAINKRLAEPDSVEL